ncbi:MAG TPA: hypothetical protein VL990_05165 [Acidobacteriaceae bacterium]|nr:hypothetical protein [Acidobacteriaceae bacterium]
MLASPRTAFALIILLGSSAIVSAPQPEPAPSSCCTMVEQAMAAASAIKAGMTRADVEKKFRLDGGISSAYVANYVFRECPTIKIEVGFERMDDKGRIITGGPSDMVKYVSRPFLDYPVMD